MPQPAVKYLLFKAGCVVTLLTCFLDKLSPSKGIFSGVHLEKSFSPPLPQLLRLLLEMTDEVSGGMRSHPRTLQEQL